MGSTARPGSQAPATTTDPGTPEDQAELRRLADPAFEQPLFDALREVADRGRLDIRSASFGGLHPDDLAMFAV